MARIIPLFLETTADFTERLELEGSIIEIRMKWNVRNDTAFIDFTDRFGNTVYGVKVVPNYPLLRQIKGFVDFRGDLMALPTNANAGSEIVYDTFGTDYKFFYLDESEVRIWEEANGSR